MSYLLSGKVQTCYSNNVFRKIKIFEYLETGRHEDYRPRRVWISHRNRIQLFGELSISDFTTESPKTRLFGESLMFSDNRRFDQFQTE